MNKLQIRRKMKALNREITPEKRLEESRAIVAGIECMEEFGRARCVGLFCSLPDEPSTEEALERWSAGKILAVPRVEGESMEFFRYDASHLATGAFGILEPSADARICPPEEIDLMVIPGVGFTPSGCRLGRGRGYYDKYLSQEGFRAFKVGICYRHQLLDEGELPCEEHDIPMDRVVTA